MDPLETRQDASCAAPCTAIRSLPSRFFAAWNAADLRDARPRDTARPWLQRPAILTGFHFTKTTLAAFAEHCEIVGHMDKPDAHRGRHPAGHRRRRAGDRQHRQRRPLRRDDGRPAAALAVLLLRHRLRARRSRGGPPAQHHDHARRRRQCARRGRDWRFGILLASTRRLVRADKMIRRGDWTQAHPQPLRRHRRPDRRQGRHPGPRRDRPGVRQAHQGLRRRDRLLQPQQAQRRRLRRISPTSWRSRPGATT